MENEPCKLSFTYWGETVSIEKPNSDISVDDFFEMVRALALGAGFSEEQINSYLDE